MSDIDYLSEAVSGYGPTDEDDTEASSAAPAPAPPSFKFSDRSERFAGKPWAPVLRMRRNLPPPMLTHLGGNPMLSVAASLQNNTRVPTHLASHNDLEYDILRNMGRSKSYYSAEQIASIASAGTNSAVGAIIAAPLPRDVRPLLLDVGLRPYATRSTTSLSKDAPAPETSPTASASLPKDAPPPAASKARPRRALSAGPSSKESSSAPPPPPPKAERGLSSSTAATGDPGAEIANARTLRQQFEQTRTELTQSNSRVENKLKADYGAQTFAAASEAVKDSERLAGKLRRGPVSVEKASVRLAAIQNELESNPEKYKRIVKTPGKSTPAH